MDPLEFDRLILPHWYNFTLLLALFCPILYISLHLSYPRNHRYQSKLTLLSFLTTFANLCSFTEPSNLSQPVYVCFYPVRGETFHHPEELRLRIQAKLFLGAAGVSGVVFVVRVGMWVLRRWRSWEGVVLRKEKEGGERDGEMSGKEIVRGWRKWELVEVLVLKGKVVLMGVACGLTLCAYLAMYGRSMKGRFGD